MERFIRELALNAAFPCFQVQPELTQRLFTSNHSLWCC